MAQETKLIAEYLSEHEPFYQKNYRTLIEEYLY